jgi:hypothetical protein
LADPFFPAADIFRIDVVFIEGQFEYASVAVDLLEPFALQLHPSQVVYRFVTADATGPGHETFDLQALLGLFQDCQAGLLEDVLGQMASWTSA